MTTTSGRHDRLILIFFLERISSEMVLKNQTSKQNIRNKTSKHTKQTNKSKQTNQQKQAINSIQTEANKQTSKPTKRDPPPSSGVHDFFLFCFFVRTRESWCWKAGHMKGIGTSSTFLWKLCRSGAGRSPLLGSPEVAEVRVTTMLMDACIYGLRVYELFGEFLLLLCRDTDCCTKPAVRSPDCFLFSSLRVACFRVQSLVLLHFCVLYLPNTLVRSFILSGGSVFSLLHLPFLLQTFNCDYCCMVTTHFVCIICTTIYIFFSWCIT